MNKKSYIEYIAVAVILVIIVVAGYAAVRQSVLKKGFGYAPTPYVREDSFPQAQQNNEEPIEVWDITEVALDANKNVVITYSQSILYRGQSAIDMAMKQTGCTKETVYTTECAPSLQNGIFLVKETPESQTTVLSQNVQIVDVNTNRSFSIETFESLFNQTDAFYNQQTGAHVLWQPLVENGDVISLQSVNIE